MAFTGPNPLEHNGFRHTDLRRPPPVHEPPVPAGVLPGPPSASTTSPTTPEPGRTATTTQWPCAPSPAQPREQHPSPAPAEPDGLGERDREFARTAASAWNDLPTPDLVGAVEAGQMTAARSGGHTSAESADDTAVHTTEVTAQAAAAVQRQGLPPISTGPADWAGFGAVIPVLAASPGAGASVVTAALADAMQLAGQRVLMVDTADPARSGLAAAARTDGPIIRGPHPAVGIRVSWRAYALLARVTTDLPVITPGMVPPPRYFKPATTSVQATVVDLSHDAWRVAAHPLAGAGAWLRTGTPPPRPVLVCRATHPGLLHAEQVLARLEAWNATGTITPPAQLVVVGAKRWPDGVPGGAGRRVAALLDTALFVPHDPGLSITGITGEPIPARVRDALTPLLRGWGLVPQQAPSTPGFLRRTKGIRP